MGRDFLFEEVWIHETSWASEILVKNTLFRKSGKKLQ